MQKKILLGIAAALVLLFVFAACEQPVSKDAVITNKVGYNTLQAPARVQAKVYNPTGFIRVSWDPVPNATAYMVYRKSVVTSSGPTNGMTNVVVRDLSPGTYAGLAVGDELSIDDTIGFDNQLRVGTNYTYKVVALSDWSSNAASGAQWSQVAEEYWNVLQNSSKDSNTVSFTALNNAGTNNGLPPQGARIATPANLEVKPGVRYVTSVGGVGSMPHQYKEEYIQVTWDIVPGVTYAIAAGVADGIAATDPFLGGNEPMRVVGTFSPTNDDTIGGYEIPLVYGSTKIDVIAIHKGTNTKAGGSPYYLNSNPATATLEKNQDLFPTPASLAGTVLAASNTARLVWDKVIGADGYRVYRLVLNNTATYIPTTMNTYVYEQWTDITANIAITDNPTDTTQCEAFDEKLTFTTGARLMYMIVAYTGTAAAPTAVSLPRVSALVQNAFAARALTAAISTTWDPVEKDWLGIMLTWSSSEDEAFELEVAEVLLNDTGAAIIGPAGNDFVWTPVSLSNAAVNFLGDYTLWVKPEYRKSYRYRLITKLGDETGVTYANAFNTLQYNSNGTTINLASSNTYATFSPQPASLNANPNFIRRNAYQLGYRISSNIDQLKLILAVDELVRISRLRTTSAGVALPGSTWTEVTTLARDSLHDNYITDSPGLGYFRYQAEIIRCTTVSGQNLSTAPTTQIAPNNPTMDAGFAQGAIAGTQFNFLTPAATVSARTTSTMNGAQLKFVYISSTVSDADAISLLNAAITGGDWEDLSVINLTINRSNGANVAPPGVPDDDYATANVNLTGLNGGTIFYAYRLYCVDGNYFQESGNNWWSNATQLTAGSTTP